MKWTGCFFSLFMVVLSLVHASDSSWEESGRNQKIDLIKSEVGYSRYLCWQIRKELLPVEDGLLWVEDILLLVDDQLEEVKNESKQ